MPQVLSWNPPGPGTQPANMIDTCVKALKAGQLVGLPTESCYFAACDPKNKSGVNRLNQLVGANPRFPLVTAINVGEKPEKVFESGGSLARRFARRVWPGPVIIAAKVGKADPVPQYAPNSGSVKQLIQALGGPLLFGAPLSAEGKPCSSHEEFIAAVGESVSVILTAGKTPYADFPSMIEIDGSKYRLPIEGVVPKPDMSHQAVWMVVFVCTGNTCRSPLAEVLCKRTIANKLGCEIEDVQDRGFFIYSMGLTAIDGNTATSEALIVAREFKTDLSAHRSRPIIPGILEAADHVLAMTAIHRDSIIALHPNLEGHVRLICGNTDLADPIGGDLDVYRKSATTIQRQLDKLVNEMMAAGVPTLLH